MKKKIINILIIFFTILILLKITIISLNFSLRKIVYSQKIENLFYEFIDFQLNKHLENKEKNKKLKIKLKKILEDV